MISYDILLARESYPWGLPPALARHSCLPAQVYGGWSSSLSMAVVWCRMQLCMLASLVVVVWLTRLSPVASAVLSLLAQAQFELGHGSLMPHQFEY